MAISAFGDVVSEAAEAEGPGAVCSDAVPHTVSWEDPTDECEDLGPCT